MRRCDACHNPMECDEWKGDISIHYVGPGCLQILGQQFRRPRTNVRLNLCHACALAIIRNNAGIITESVGGSDA